MQDVAQQPVGVFRHGRSRAALSADDLKARVTEACSRYRKRLAADRASGYLGNKDLDPFIQNIAARSGTDGAALRAAVDTICPK